MTADFYRFLSSQRGQFVQDDPVNLLFFGQGGASKVHSLLSSQVPYVWSPTRAAALYAWIDDTQHGGQAAWKDPDVNLRLGSFWKVSFHIRAYEAPQRDSHSQYGTWSLASVHTEVLAVGHAILHWTEGRDLLQQWLAGIPSVSGTRLRKIGNEGVFQGRYHDGQMLEVELM